MRQSRVFYAVAIGMLAATTACSQQPPTATAPGPTAPENVQPDATQAQREALQAGRRGGGDGGGRSMGQRGGGDGDGRSVGQRGGGDGDGRSMGQRGGGDDDGRSFGRRGDRDDTDDRDGDRRRSRYRFSYLPYYQTYVPYTVPYYQSYAQSTVVIRGYQYLPGNLNVTVGTTVTWINQDSVPHTVTSPLPGQVTTTGYFDGVLQPGQSYSYTFNLPGRIDYYCRYHPYMRGSVTVGAVY